MKLQLALVFGPSIGAAPALPQDKSDSAPGTGVFLISTTKSSLNAFTRR